MCVLMWVVGWVGCLALSQETRGPAVTMVACLRDDMLGSTGAEAEAFD